MAPLSSVFWLSSPLYGSPYRGNLQRKTPRMHPYLMPSRALTRPWLAIGNAIRISSGQPPGEWVTLYRAIFATYEHLVSYSAGAVRCEGLTVLEECFLLTLSVLSSTAASTTFYMV